MFSIFRDADQLENVEEQLHTMLASCEDAYRLATTAAFGEADVSEAGDQLMALDKAINKTERSIRRELLVHGTVKGADVDQGLMLTYMSLAKDIERIGDKCKDIWELAEIGANLGISEDVEELQRHRVHVGELIAETLAAFTAQDTERVHELIPAIREDRDHYDGHVTELVMSTRPSHEASPQALFYRYIKRLSAHLSNILSSIVMPIDRLDFYNPDKAIEETDPSG
jgi:phosphate uptake regulator